MPNLIAAAPPDNDSARLSPKYGKAIRAGIAERIKREDIPALEQAFLLEQYRKAWESVYGPVSRGSKSSKLGLTGTSFYKHVEIHCCIPKRTGWELTYIARHLDPAAIPKLKKIDPPISRYRLYRLALQHNALSMKGTNVDTLRKVWQDCTPDERHRFLAFLCR